MTVTTRHRGSTSTRWHFAFGLCCHSNETSAPLSRNVGPKPIKKKKYCAKTYAVTGYRAGRLINKEMEEDRDSPIVHNLGIPPIIPPSYIRDGAVVWAYGRGQLDTQTRVTNIHFASSTTHAKCNYRPRTLSSSCVNIILANTCYTFQGFGV